MTTRDRDSDPFAPSSPASASPLRAPSEEAAERAARDARAAEAAAEAEERAQAAEAKQRAAEEAEAERRIEEEKETVAAFARAPTGVVHSVRFFFVMMAFVLLSTLFVMEWLSEDPFLPWPAAPIVLGAWGAALAFIAIDAATWRRRLPFVLEGYDRIGGGHTFAKDESPWIEYRVRIELVRSTKEAKDARDEVLDMLAVRVHALMKKDEDFHYSSERAWRITERHGLRGAYSRQLYRLRVLERWLRTDVARLAKRYPIKRVVVDAHYTGTSRTIATAD